MKKVVLFVCFAFAVLAFVPTKANSKEISIEDMEYLVDNRIKNMGIEDNIKSCVKKITMEELQRRGAIQTYILDLVIRKIIAEAASYCRR